jgi:hypothetical protein
MAMRNKKENSSEKPGIPRFLSEYFISGRKGVAGYV